MERGVTDCPLCREFYISTSQKCDLNCPIKRKTNRDGCRETPYEQWILSFRNLETHEDRSISTSRFKEESLVAAKTELQFLKDLYIEWLEKARVDEEKSRPKEPPQEKKPEWAEWEDITSSVHVIPAWADCISVTENREPGYIIFRFKLDVMYGGIPEYMEYKIENGCIWRRRRT